MDKNKLVLKIKAIAPGGLLRTGTFGHPDHKLALLWVEMRQLKEITQYLRHGEPEQEFDWLENLAVMVIEGALVITYFLRSRFNPEQRLVLRGSVVPETSQTTVEVVSVTSVWPEAAYFEQEAGEFFGIHFKGEDPNPTGEGKKILPAHWQGFPLRKGYRFPVEFDGIQHKRAVEVSE